MHDFLKELQQCGDIIFGALYFKYIVVVRFSNVELEVVRC